MKKYKVTLDAMVLASAVIEVEAENEEAAKTEALCRWQEDTNDRDWKPVDIPQDEPVVNEVKETL